MKIRHLLAAAVAASVVVIPSAFAQSPAPAASEAAAQPAQPAQPEVAKELAALVDKVKAKLSAGQQTAEALAPELKEFDALSAKYAAEKTDAVAMVSVMKARLYLEVFEDKKTGVELLKQVKADFPETTIGKRMDGYLAAMAAEEAAEAATAVGQPFAPFAEQDLNGAPLNLADYKGKIVLVDFWATWCGPCVAELPNVLAAYEKYHAKGFEIVGISLDKDRGALTSFIAEKKMAWPQYFDGKGWENKLAQAYGIHSIPATFLLDGEGKIVGKGLRGPALEAKLAELLGAAK